MTNMTSGFLRTIWATYPDIAVLLNSETFEKLGA